MANTKLRCICFLLAVSYALSDTFDGGRKESVKHKGTIKTIKVIMIIIIIIFFIQDSRHLSSFSFQSLYNSFGKISGLLIHGLLKSLQGMNDDVIDCVNIYQQPAFDHPLLKNHIIQVALLLSQSFACLNDVYN
jgi:hypothetical protein